MSNIRVKLFFLLDLALIFGAFGLAFPAVAYLHNHLPQDLNRWAPEFRFLEPNGPGGSPVSLRGYLWIYAFVAPIACLALTAMGAHRPIREQSLPRMILSATAAPLIGIGVLSTVLVVFQPPGYSRIFILAFGGFCFVVTLGARLIGRKWYRYTLRERLHTESVAIIARPEIAGRLARIIQSNPDAGECDIAGYFPLEGDAVDSLESDVFALGSLPDLRLLLNWASIQHLVVALPSGNNAWLAEVLGSCEYFGVKTSIIPETLITSPPAELMPTTRGLANLPALTLVAAHSHADWLYVKRVFDVIISGALLILLSPVFLFVAIAIRLTTPKLSVFHRSACAGRCGRRFYSYKFTTMIADAHKMQAELEALNEMKGPVFKIKKDPRVTPLGRILRKFDLNELPQLWNVFRGDMSLVGPRPPMCHEVDRYEVWHKSRLKVQPGITCLWQVRGRNDISNFDDWVQLDLEYIRTRSLWVDFKILAQTAIVVLRGTGS